MEWNKWIKTGQNIKWAKQNLETGEMQKKFWRKVTGKKTKYRAFNTRAKKGCRNWERGSF